MWFTHEVQSITDLPPCLSLTLGKDSHLPNNAFTANYIAIYKINNFHWKLAFLLNSSFEALFVEYGSHI